MQTKEKSGLSEVILNGVVFKRARAHAFRARIIL